MEKLCQICNNKIPEEVEVCTYCGGAQKSGKSLIKALSERYIPQTQGQGKRQKMSMTMKVLLVFFGILIYGFVQTTVFRKATNQPSPIEYTDTNIRLTARQLNSEYEKNEIRADEIYKGKLLEVSGIVSDIGKIWSTAYIKIEAGWAHNLTCMLSDSEKSKASYLVKGQSITMEGKNLGKTLGNVQLSNCIIK